VRVEEGLEVRRGTPGKHSATGASGSVRCGESTLPVDRWAIWTSMRVCVAVGMENKRSGWVICTCQG